MKEKLKDMCTEIRTREIIVFRQKEFIDVSELVSGLAARDEAAPLGFDKFTY